jgi:transposase
MRQRIHAKLCAEGMIEIRHISEAAIQRDIQYRRWFQHQARRCPNCKTEHQRDENAIVNIFVEGLRILAEGRSVAACGGTVRPKREPRRAPVKQETSLETSSNAA